MEARILDEMKKIDELGGMIAAVESGYIQREVSRQAYKFEKGLQKGEYIKVGVNRYTEEESQEVELHEYKSESAENQIRALRELKASRDQKAVEVCLRSLEDAVKNGDNVMPHLISCCKAYVTVGEMTGVFRKIYGEFNEPSIF
jgi:methylmalonyl-CoA mutase N-terminal domain/subunit